MKHKLSVPTSVLIAVLLLWPGFLSGQGTRADYERSQGLRDKLQGIVVDQPEAPSWIGSTHKFSYRKSVAGGNEFWLVDAEAKTKAPAFDHARLAAALAAELKDKVEPKKLPFTTIIVRGRRESHPVRGRRVRAGSATSHLRRDEDRPGRAPRASGAAAGWPRAVPRPRRRHPRPRPRPTGSGRPSSGTTMSGSGRRIKKRSPP